MSWASKTIKKIKRYIKKNPISLVPGVGQLYTLGDLSREAGEGINKNWEDIRMPLAMGVAGALTGGLAGAALGAAGLAGGLGVTGAASAGAITGAATGTAQGLAAQEDLHAQQKAAKEAEEAAAEQQRLSDLRATGNTPAEASEISFGLRDRTTSQYRRNIRTAESRKNKKLGSSGSTLG